jgi:murein L,D-transpeptidase YafK
LKVKIVRKLEAIAWMIAASLPLSLAAQAKIPDCMLSYRFGPEQYIVIVQKATQDLFIYSNYRAEPVENFKITSGKNHGAKLVEGDMKTPEGIYFFRNILSGKELPKTDDYGEKAFTLNYPNPIDRKEQRDGSGIWLHGAFDANKIDTPNNSRGCVVMKNQDLVKASKYIFLNKTPIFIYNNIKYESVEQIVKKRERLIHHLKEWKEQWQNKDIDGYIRYYDKDFYYNGMDRTRFKAFKRRLNDRYRFIRVILSDINIYAFGNYFVATFNQLYISDLNQFYSKKIQYWLDEGDNPRIADEYSFSLPTPDKFEISTGNYITIAEFRKDYLKQLKANTFTLTPRQIHLKNLSLFRDTVKLVLIRPEGAGDLRVIPVLGLEKDETTRFQSVPGIELNGGIPRDYSRGLLLKNRETTFILEKETDFKLKSLTLFLIGSNNQHEQIITYFFNQ